MSRIIIYIALFFFINLCDLICFQIQIAPNIKSIVSNITPEDVLDNPSKMYYLERNSISTSYIPSSFGIKELNKNTLFAVYGDSTLFHSINIEGNFDTKFSSSNIKYSFGYKLFDNFVTAVSINHHYLSIAKYNDYNAFTIDMSGILELSDNLNFGYSITNLFNSSFISVNNITNQTALFGMEFKLDPNFSLQVGTEIRIENSSSVVFGFVKRFEDLGKIGLSYSTVPQMVELNLLAHIAGDFSIIYNLNYHSYLGVTNQFGLGYFFD